MLILKTESTIIILTVQSIKLETEMILMNEKNYQDLTIYFTRYYYSKSIKMFSLHYHELLRKTKVNEGKKYLMDNNYMLDKLLHEIK